jgi:hypothetical protein
MLQNLEAESDASVRPAEKMARERAIRADQIGKQDRRGGKKPEPTSSRLRTQTDLAVKVVQTLDQN